MVYGTLPLFYRVAAGDYETADGRFRLYRLCNVWPPAWNVEAADGMIVVDGAATKGAALIALAAKWCA